MTTRFAALIATAGLLATAGAFILPGILPGVSARYLDLRWRSQASTGFRSPAATSPEQ